MSDPAPSAPTLPPNLYRASRGELKTLMDDPARVLPAPDSTPARPSRLQQHLKTVLGPGSLDLDATLRPAPTRAAPALDRSDTLVMAPAQDFGPRPALSRELAGAETIIKPRSALARELQLAQTVLKAQAATAARPTAQRGPLKPTAAPAPTARPQTRRLLVLLAVGAVVLAGALAAVRALGARPQFEGPAIVEIKAPPAPVPAR